MISRRAYSACMTLAAGTTLLFPFLTAPAAAAPPTGDSTLDSCYLRVVSISDGGRRVTQQITARPTGSSRDIGPRLYGNDEASLTTSWGYEPVVPAGNQYGAFVVLNGSMYWSSFTTDGDGQEVPGSTFLTRIGGGWGSYRYIEHSGYFEGGSAMRYRRHQAYGLVGNDIYRWTLNSKGWTAKARFQGYKAVKTMVLISQQRGYDTFLANTYGGALYTIRIPLSGSPVVKVVRSRTWQSFEAMVADRCGNQSTLLTGIDRDTGDDHVYAIGHATGRTTVINSLGEVDTTFFNEPVAREYLDNEYTEMLNGE